MASDSALPWYYCAYITVFSIYVVARLVSYLDYLKNTDPVWLIRDSISSWYVLNVIGFAVLGLFLVALCLTIAKTKMTDALNRAHARYMLWAFWSMLAIWGVEFFLYWSPLAIFFHWFEPHLRFVAGFLYLFLLIKLVIGFVRFKNKQYPSPREPLGIMEKSIAVLSIISVPFVLHWVIVYGVFYYQDLLSVPGDDYTFTVLTKGKSSDSPYNIRLVYRTKKPGALCKEESSWSGKMGDRQIKSDQVRAPVVTTEHEQIFKFGAMEIEPGYCDWHLDGIEMFSGQNGGFTRLPLTMPDVNEKFVKFSKTTNFDWRYEFKYPKNDPACNRYVECN